MFGREIIFKTKPKENEGIRSTRIHKSREDKNKS